MKRDGNLVKIALSVSYYLKKEGHPFKNTYKKEMFQYLFLSISREPSYEEDRQWFCLALHEIFGCQCAVWFLFSTYKPSHHFMLQIDLPDRSLYFINASNLHYLVTTDQGTIK